MFSPLFSRRIGLVTAGVALISLTAACGGSANSEICNGAAWSKAFSDYTASATAAAADANKLNEANQKLSSDLKDLAAKADGELATALTEFADSFGSLKIDANDPAATATAASSFSAKIQEAGTKLAAACS
ncbi:methyl-accepting chemotaxis protein [Streptosporangium becharense]|uniref:Methyl-accepting chemotaxis protein n=1 Tax=Streptosporangium becharense TaxID=1816182 RepID=A0A7W9IJY0_9ACTN|nr:hypothetical protein [Streptosporangium becharense]MBB2911132.1 methyl-accepting chemotaxis protein [Streptosporangium becharense]MBB5821810.1 methyl-accepting chemotaxis protein [Streptosporangium becharense]